MSEYQYYEFQAIDRPLTQKQMTELRGYSSRAQITATSFVNVYHWGDFKGNPGRWMEQYFDAFLYLANWGSRTLMFRLPSKFLAPDLVKSYCAGKSFSCRMKGESCILVFDSQEKDDDPAGGEGWLSSLISLRSDLMRGDCRCLYLGWLLAVQDGDVGEDVLDPPIPPNLGNLHAPLQSLVDFLQIDHDLIAAAAERSAHCSNPQLSKADIALRVSQASWQEKDEFLVRLAEADDPHLALEFRKRILREAKPEATAADSEPGQRRVAELLARCAAIRENRVKQEAERRAREEARRERQRVQQRQAHLDSLVGKENDLWERVERLIATKQSKPYDEAVSVLADLRELAERQSASSGFSERIATLCQAHARKPSLTQKLRAAGLCT